MNKGILNKKLNMYNLLLKPSSFNEEKIIQNENSLNKKVSNDISDVKNSLKNFPHFNENFELLEKIGSGSESEVFKINHKKIKKSFALKYIIYNKKVKKSQNLNELNIASKLNNSNIIKFHGYLYSKENNSEFMIMENAKYGNIRDFQTKILKRSCLSESLLCFYANQILNGLYFCHKCRIAHMDIKPQNIVIDEYLNAKLIDFSISINYSGKKPNDKLKLPFKGTNFYMSPEVINSDVIQYKDINKIDIYSLGVVLFRLGFGYYPFKLEYGDEDNYKIINQKINCEFEIKNENNYFSSYFIDFISKLLRKDINKRMSIYEALQHPWLKGAKILLNEKENISNTNIFVQKMIVDNIKDFNDYLKQ